MTGLKPKIGLIRYSILAVMATMFLLLFSASTSPLSNYYGTDSAFFIMVGKGLLNGRLPYRDFFDMKGPYLFFLQSLGQLIYPGRTGAFILQTFFLFADLCIIDRIINLPYRRFCHWFWRESLCILPCLYTACTTFHYGNRCEELSLPFLLLALWLYLKQNKPGNFQTRDSFLYGLIVGFLALIRITNAALLASIILTVFIELLLQKRFMRLVYSVIAFLSGILATSLPICLFFAHHGLLDEMLYQVFIFGVKYATETSLFDKLLAAVSSYWPIILLAALPLFVLAIYRQKDPQRWLFSSLSFVFFLVAVCAGNNYPHYYTLGIPNLVYGIFLLIEQSQCSSGDTLKNEPRQRLLILLCVVLLLCQGPKTYHYTIRNLGRVAGIINDDAYYENAYEVQNLIPESDWDNVFAYDLDYCSGWYFVADLYPPHRYCDWQKHYIALIPEIGQELSKWLSEKNPAWIITNRDEPLSPDIIKNAIEENYSIYAQTSTYTLYAVNP